MYVTRCQKKIPKVVDNRLNIGALMVHKLYTIIFTFKNVVGLAEVVYINILLESSLGFSNRFKIIISFNPLGKGVQFFLLPTTDFINVSTYNF